MNSQIYMLYNGPIALMLFTEGTHQAYFVYPMNPSNLIAYSMDTSNLRYLQYGSIKRMLFTGKFDVSMMYAI
jgi:hypothetical protein